MWPRRVPTLTTSESLLKICAWVAVGRQPFAQAQPATGRVVLDEIEKLAKGTLAELATTSAPEHEVAKAIGQLESTLRSGVEELGKAIADDLANAVASLRGA